MIVNHCTPKEGDAMPSEPRKSTPNGPNPSNTTERRAILVLSDGRDIPERLDQMTDAVRRRPGLKPVNAAHDTATRDGFTEAVMQRQRGDGDVIVVEELPDWIVVLGPLPRQRGQRRQSLS